MQPVQAVPEPDTAAEHDRHLHDVQPAAPPAAGPPRQYPGRVRLTDFWARMRAQFGDVYAQSVAKDFVFDKLGGRTIERALAEGVDAKVVWRAVVDTFDVPQRLR
jgi:Protein of unknown function (DUF3046)